MVKCPECGKKNLSKDDFCEKCGHKLKKEVKKLTLGLIVSWVLGVMFGISALGFIFQGAVKSGTALVLASLILLPPVNIFIKKEFNFEMSRGLKIIIVIILLIVYAVCLPKDISEEITLTKTTSGEEKINDISESKTTTKPQEDITLEEKEIIYSMNENIQVDYLTYRIIKAQSFTEMGISMFNKQTNGKFVKVYLDMLNNAKETKQMFTPRFSIEDNQGRKYERLSDDMMYISDYLEFGKELQPGLKTSGAIVFEMPKDSTELKLIISGDWTSISEVKVSLSNIIDIGKDTTQQEEQDKLWEETLEESEEKMEELMNQCNAPFICASREACPEYMDVGRKDCPSGYVCCMQ